MKTAIFICVICTMIDFMTIGLTAALCMDKFTYSHGMVLGIHLPKEAACGGEIQELLRRWKKQYTRFMLWNLLASVLIMGLAFWYTSVFFIVYTVWLIEFIAGLCLLFTRCARRLYRIKAAHGWICGEPAGSVLPDTDVEEKQRQAGGAETQEVLVDGDYYWRKGWYCNPQDRRLWIQDRIFETNYGINMGHPAAKKICAAAGVLLLGTAAFLIWLAVMLLRIDFTKIGLDIGPETVRVEAGMYEISFARGEIQKLELVAALPDERMRRTNGSADDRLLLGNFKGDESGACKLYVYRGYSPILKIVLPEYTVFINSSSGQEVEAWYGELAKGAGTQDDFAGNADPA